MAAVLTYFEVRRSEGASRTAFASLLSALRFLEEAGEVAEANKLHSNPALTNAEKEVSVAAAAQNPGSGQTPGQAPQLPLAVLAALERAVLNLEHTDYHRAFAGFRLLRHSSFLRWDDTQGLPQFSGRAGPQGDGHP